MSPRKPTKSDALLARITRLERLADDNLVVLAGVQRSLDGMINRVNDMINKITSRAEATSPAVGTPNDNGVSVPDCRGDAVVCNELVRLVGSHVIYQVVGTERRGAKGCFVTLARVNASAAEAPADALALASVPSRNVRKVGYERPIARDHRGAWIHEFDEVRRCSTGDVAQARDLGSSLLIGFGSDTVRSDFVEVIG